MGPKEVTSFGKVAVGGAGAIRDRPESQAPCCPALHSFLGVGLKQPPSNQEMKGGRYKKKGLGLALGLSYAKGQSWQNAVCLRRLAKGSPTLSEDPG